MTSSKGYLPFPFSFILFDVCLENSSSSNKKNLFRKLTQILIKIGDNNKSLSLESYSHYCELYEPVNVTLDKSFLSIQQNKE